MDSGLDLLVEHVALVLEFDKLVHEPLLLRRDRPHLLFHVRVARHHLAGSVFSV